MKLIFSLFLTFVINQTFAQLKHLPMNYSHFNADNIRVVLDGFGPLNGNVKKIIYETEKIIFGIEYDENGNLFFSRYFRNPDCREEILGIFDKNDELTKVKLTKFWYDFEKKMFKDEVDEIYAEKFRFNDLDKQISYAAILYYDENNSVRQIDAEIINQHELTRETAWINTRNSEIINLEDFKTIDLPKIIDAHRNIKLDYKAEIRAGFSKIGYEKNEIDKPSWVQTSVPTKNKGERELVKTPLIYETKTTGKYLMNGFMDIKFVLKGGAFFEVLVDEATKISGETYLYDQQGNWINYEYWMEEEEGQKVKKKEKRYIEYWK